MSEPRRDQAPPEPPPETPPSAPRWVRIAAIVVGVLLVLVAIAVLTGLAHGPGKHFGSDGPPARSAIEAGNR